ncbi:hypothetical protein ACH5RR_040437 [Cinchona calisaya]|uniref:Uncharacterized protein n=1 Tax=Cinchona calisaya TaxID=153742 RepID=A0ABD2XUF5_9GENT
MARRLFILKKTLLKGGQFKIYHLLSLFCSDIITYSLPLTSPSVLLDPICIHTIRNITNPCIRPQIHRLQHISKHWFISISILSLIHVIFLLSCHLPFYFSLSALLEKTNADVGDKFVV